MKNKIKINGRSYGVTKHAMYRLRQRFNLDDLPNCRMEFLFTVTNTRKVYHLEGTDIFPVIKKTNKIILTFLDREMYRNMLRVLNVGISDMGFIDGAATR